MLYKFISFIARVLVRFLFHLEVKGKGNVYKVKGAILAVNHTSFFDPVIVGGICPRPIYYLARKDLFEYRFLGPLCRKVNAIPFNRDAPDLRALREIIELLRKGKLVLIFPEGTRSPDGEFLPAQPGIGFVALRAKVPVIPVYIKGAYKVLPRHRNFIRLAKVTVSFGEPMYPDTWLHKHHIEKTDYQELAELIMARIRYLKGK